MSWINPKSLFSAYVVKPYVLLIVICPSNGNIKSGRPLVLFDKSWLMQAPDYIFTLPHLTFISLTYALILDIFP
jgi:hypothetical protein